MIAPEQADPGIEEEAQRAHRTLLARLRHELRTPLNAILGYSELLLEDLQDRDDQTLTRDLNKLHAAGVELLARLNDALANDRIVSGQLDDLSAVRTRLHDQLHTPADAVLGYSELVIEEAR
ncbi:MAG: histidine kinase dimerization/phospho-acceptor domain-containing protein, partial [Anaerolineae bacterium]